jgi:phosphatidylglycerophosphatase A
LGKLPFSPGTFGTIGALPLILVLAPLGAIPYMIATFTIVVFAIWISQMHELLNATHDSSEIVIDEVAGILVAMAFVPLTWKTLALGFILFRIFDILKPFPISWMDRKIKGGVGVVVDDVAAGLVVNVLLQLALTYGKAWL